MNTNWNPDFSYRPGDLVKWQGSLQVFVGIVIDARYVFTSDNRFLVRTPDGDSWVGAHKLSLLSAAARLHS